MIRHLKTTNKKKPLFPHKLNRQFQNKNSATILSKDKKKKMLPNVYNSRRSNRRNYKKKLLVINEIKRNCMKSIPLKFYRFDFLKQSNVMEPHQDQYRKEAEYFHNEY